MSEKRGQDQSDLIKLVGQLARRVPNLELDSDVVKGQVAAFKTIEADILKKLASTVHKPATAQDNEAGAVAKLAEEMKALPSRVAERLAEFGDSPRRRSRRIHPAIFHEIFSRSEDSADPATILIAASLVRDELPWLNEIAVEIYRAIRAGNLAEASALADSMSSFREVVLNYSDYSMPFSEELHFVTMEFARTLQKFVRKLVNTKRLVAPRARESSRNEKDTSS